MAPSRTKKGRICRTFSLFIERERVPSQSSRASYVILHICSHRATHYWGQQGKQETQRPELHCFVFAWALPNCIPRTWYCYLLGSCHFNEFYAILPRYLTMSQHCAIQCSEVWVAKTRAHPTPHRGSTQCSKFLAKEKRPRDPCPHAPITDRQRYKS